MKKAFLGLLIVFGIVAISGSVACADDTGTLISITADYWMPSIDANVKSSELGFIGTDIDIIDDLGLEDSENVPAVRGSIDLPLFPEILVSYFSVDDSATKTITKSITYKGTTYTAATSVTSSYDITHFEALLNFAVINAETANVGLLIGGKYFEVETSLSGGGITKSESVEGPIPVIGVKAGIGFPNNFRIEGIARGLVLEVGDVDASLFDIDVGLHYDFNKFLRASAGYRYFAIDAEDTSDNVSDKVDIKFTGPYIGVTGSF